MDAASSDNAGLSRLDSRIADQIKLDLEFIKWTLESTKW